MFFKQATVNAKIIEINSNNIPQLYKTAAKHWTDVNAFPNRYKDLFGNYVIANKIRIGEYNPEFKYYRVIAMHGDEPNQNGDLWHWGSADDPSKPELLRYDDSLKKQVYSTFNGRGIFTNHQNDDVTKATGIILDTIPNHDGKHIEALVAVDSIKSPQLVRGIDNNYIKSVSMGCLCGYSICTYCGHKAYNENQYCDHLKQAKCRKVSSYDYMGLTLDTIAEDNRQVNFIELSFVDLPADPGANLLEKVASKIILSEDGGLMYDAILTAIDDARLLCPDDYNKLLKAINYQISKKVAELSN